MSALDLPAVAPGRNPTGAAAVDLIRWQDLVALLTRTNRLTDTHRRAYQESLSDFDRLRGMN